MPPYQLDHKLIEFALAALVVLLLCLYYGSNGNPPRHRR